MWLRRLNPFEILKVVTLILLAALLFSVGSASHATSLVAYLSFSVVMGLQALEVFAPVFSEKTRDSHRRNLLLRLSILIQMVLASALVAVTDGSGSIYELVYLLPIISAATKLPGRDVVYVVAGSIIAIIGFIVTGEQLTPFITHVKEFQDAVAAMVYFTMAGLLVYFFAQSEREQRERSQTLATNLAHSNDELRQTQTQLTERLAQLTKMEERLQQVSQMAVLGEMAGQVAHEVRNPLGIIKGSVEMLAARTTDPAIRRYIEVVLEETNRLNKAVEGVLRLGAPLCLNKASVSLSTLLNSVVQVSFAWSVPERVSVDCAPISPGTVVQGDFDLLHQAFANLVRNACQAMPSGGIVKLSCDLQTEKQRVNIMIEDRGIGMAEDDLKRLGEPFFTKRKGGIGLGFSLAYRVIKEHGGALQVTSLQGRGTTVTISLPMSVNLYEEQLAGSSGRERI